MPQKPRFMVLVEGTICCLGPCKLQRSSSARMAGRWFEVLVGGAPAIAAAAVLERVSMVGGAAGRDGLDWRGMVPVLVGGGVEAL